MDQSLFPSKPHDQTLFSLVPCNELSRQAVLDPQNRPYVSAVRLADDLLAVEYGFNIGLHIPSKARHTIVTCGREGQICFDSSKVSRQQFSFDEEMNVLLHDILRALAYLEREGIIHRDIKPPNILYTKCPPTTSRPQGHLYQLADFGVSNFLNSAVTYSGSEFYMAPEIYQHHGQNQTTSGDVWSLYVSLVDIAKPERIKTLDRNDYGLLVQRLVEIANEEHFDALKGMVELNPQKRASATQMLSHLYGEQVGPRQTQSNGSGGSTDQSSQPGSTAQAPNQQQAAVMC